MSKGNVALGALALVAVTGWAWAFTSVDGMDADAAAYTPPSVAEMNARADATVEPEPDSEPTAEPVTFDVSLDDARDALTEDGAVLGVLGDSTGNDSDEWVALWAAERPWVEVVNASVPGSRANDALGQVADLLPPDVDVVVLNYGHNHSTGNVDEIAALLGEVAEHAPDAVPVMMLQNPQLGDANADVRDAVAAVAAAAGVPTVDVAAAFEDDGRDLSSLLVDDLHPNGEGSRVWADAVAEALG